MDKNPELIDEIKGHKNTILTAKFSPDDRNVIAAGVEGAIYFHKLNQSSYHYKIFAHDDVIYSLDYAAVRGANSHYFLSGSRDKSVKLWRIGSLEQELTKQEQEFEPVVYRCHNNTVRFVHISPLNSSMFCTGSDDKTIKIWSANVPNKRLNTLSSHTNWIRCCKFSRRNADLLASCGDDSTLRLFDLRANGMRGAVLKTITTARNRHFTYLDWFPLSEHFIAVSSSNNMIRIFDLRNMARIVQFYRPFSDSVNCLQFHPSGQYLLASSADATSKLINVVEGRLLYTLKAHYKSIFHCTFSTDGSRFLTAGKDKSLKLWRSNLAVAGGYDSDDGLVNSDLENLSFERSSARRPDHLNVSLNEDRSTIITSATNRLNRSVDSEYLADRLMPTDRLKPAERSTERGNRTAKRDDSMHRNFSSRTIRDQMRSTERHLNQSLSSVNRESHCLNRRSVSAGRLKHPHQSLMNDPDIDSLIYETANNREDFKCQRPHRTDHQYPHRNHQLTDAHCNHPNRFNRRCPHANRTLIADSCNQYSSTECLTGVLPSDSFPQANEIAKNKIREDLLLTNSELDCLFSQLSILESSLSRVERRLLNLEAKLNR